MIKLTAKLFALFLVFNLGFIGPARAADSWVGKLVMPKEYPVFMLGDKQVEVNSIKLTVTQENGDWLWIGSAWVKKQYVVQIEDAPAYFANYIRNHSDDEAWGYYMKASAWNSLKEYDNAIKDFTEALRIDPSSKNSYNGRAIAWYRKGDYQRSIADYTQSIRLAPSYAIAYTNRGSVYDDMGEHDKAIEDYNRAIKIDPQYKNAYFDRGIAWTKKKEFDKAIADLNEATRLDPAYADAFVYRALAKLNSGKTDAAIKDYDHAIKVAPHNSYGYSARAWFLATHRDAKYRNAEQALKDAKKACELSSWNEAGPLDSLGAAYAESQDFENAVKSQEKALALLDKSNPAHKKDFEEMSSRLELYKEKKPYRDTEIPAVEKAA